MNDEEEKPAEGEKPTEEEKPSEGEKEPDAPSDSTKLINNANAAAERMEKATKKMEAVTARQEALNVAKTLGGEAEAGAGNKEETPEEYAERILANDTETPTGS